MFLYTLREKLKNSQFLQKKRYRIIFFLSLVINAGVWYVLHTIFRFQVLQLGSNLIPLHYNIYFGIDYYGNFNLLYVLAGFGLLILFMNTFLAFKVSKKMKILSAYLMYSSLVIQIIVAWALFLIMKFNS